MSALNVTNSGNFSTGGTSLCSLECTSHSTCSDLGMHWTNIEVRKDGESYWLV